MKYMYLGIDIGGTKTLVAALSQNGEIAGSVKFATPPDYHEFLKELDVNIRALPFDDFQAGCVAAPGIIDHVNGVMEHGGNLQWQNVPIQHDIEKLTRCPIILENDAKLAGLSEAMLLKDKHAKVLYITISTGIGTGFIVDQQIERNLANIEGGQMLVQRGDKLVKWESFASGKAIYNRYQQKASDINDPAIWGAIVKDWTVGFMDLLAITQPDIIVIGGSVGHYLEKYHDLLITELKQYETPILPIPPIIKAQRPEEAVIYGCYDLVRGVYA